ncbi:MAG: hypothetical protein V3T56_08975 [Gemmatimonadales bacterium]
MLATVALTACTSIVDFGRVVAIDVVGPTVPELEEGDTLRMVGYAVSAAGDSVADAVVSWVAVVPDSAPTVLSIDSSGLIMGLLAGTGFVQAKHENLATPLITVVVTSRPDTAFSDSTRFVVPTGDTVSTAMTVTVAVYPDTGTALILAAGKPVQFLLLEPAGGSAVQLVHLGGFLGTSPDSLDVTTVIDGTATALLQQSPGGTLPDSAVVHVIAFTAQFDTVPGTPLRFVVTFP